MKKSNSVGERRELAEASKLSQAEMEYEVDHCAAPWKCPSECYTACVGCLMERGGCV